MLPEVLPDVCSLNYMEDDAVTDDGKSTNLSTSFFKYEASQFATEPFLEPVYKFDELQKTFSDVSTVESAHTGNNIKFSTNFECGSLDRVDRIHFSKNRVGDPEHYVLYLRADPINCPNPELMSASQWFFFRMTSAKTKRVNVRLHIVNFSKKDCMLANGMRPVGILDDGNGSSSSEKWSRVGAFPVYRPALDANLPIPFEEIQHFFCYSLTIELPGRSDDVSGMYLAFSQPYTYSRLQNFLLAAAKSPHVKRDILCKTSNGHQCNLITATYNLQEDELLMDSVTENDNEDDSGSDGDSEGAQRRHKPVIFIVARAAAADTPASFVAEGIISWLSSGNEAAIRLLKKFVFMIVPLLNPEGTALGYSRTDSAGHDLLRAWHDPDEKQSPTIHHCKNLLWKILKQRRLASCIDLNGHSRRTGTTWFGIQQLSTTEKNLSPKKKNKKSKPRRIAEAVVPKALQWDMLLAFMRRAPFMMDHRGCSFEKPCLLTRPKAKTSSHFGRLDSKKSKNDVSVDKTEFLPLCLRQALFRVENCPPLVFSCMISFYKGSKGVLSRRHLHAGDYQTMGNALIFALAETLGITIHRNNRESYISLKNHNTVGGSQAAHIEIDSEFVVLERALSKGNGSMRDRHTSFNIAQAVQVPGQMKCFVDDDDSNDLEEYNLQQSGREEQLRKLGWHSDFIFEKFQQNEDSLSNDTEEEIAEDANNDKKELTKQLFCHECDVFGHEYGVHCPVYVPPPPPKQRKDEEYFVTDTFYERVVKRYMKSTSQDTAASNIRKYGTGKPYMPSYASQTSSSAKTVMPVSKAFKFPKLNDVLDDNEMIWLANHYPDVKHTFGLKSRKLAEQVDAIQNMHDDFVKKRTMEFEAEAETGAGTYTKLDLALLHRKHVEYSSEKVKQDLTAGEKLEFVYPIPMHNAQNETELISPRSPRFSSVFNVCPPSQLRPSSSPIRKRLTLRCSQFVPQEIALEADSVRKKHLKTKQAQNEPILVPNARRNIL